MTTKPVTGTPIPIESPKPSGGKILALLLGIGFVYWIATSGK